MLHKIPTWCKHMPKTSKAPEGLETQHYGKPLDRLWVVQMLGEQCFTKTLGDLLFLFLFIFIFLCFQNKSWGFKHNILHIIYRKEQTRMTLYACSWKYMKIWEVKSQVMIWLCKLNLIGLCVVCYVKTKTAGGMLTCWSKGSLNQIKQDESGFSDCSSLSPHPASLLSVKRQESSSVLTRDGAIDNGDNGSCWSGCSNAAQ